MPNAKILSEKQAVVAELTEKLKSAASGVLVDYKGITVAEDTALRAECRKNEVDYAVVKNTLVRFAINSVGMEEMDGALNGTTSLAVSHGDPIAPMRVINKFAKQFNGSKFAIKAGHAAAGAQRSDLFLLQDAQEAGLQRQRHIADLIKKQHPAVSLADFTDIAIFAGAGKRPRGL